MPRGIHMLGRKLPPETIAKMRSGIHKGSNNPSWKGEEASYFAKHIWVNTHFGRIMKCEHCKSEEKKKYEWANISKTYKRERNDWIRLCTSCHRKYDKHHIKMWETRRKKLLTDI